MDLRPMDSRAAVDAGEAVAPGRGGEEAGDGECDDDDGDDDNDDDDHDPASKQRAKEQVKADETQSMSSISMTVATTDGKWQDQPLDRNSRLPDRPPSR